MTGVEVTKRVGGGARAWVKTHNNQLLALLLCVSLAFALFSRTWRAPTSTFLGLPGDPPLHMWFLRWTPWALANGQNPFFTDHINFPDGINLLWNTTMPLTGILMAPLTMVANPVVVYNAVITLSVGFSGWCTYLMLRRYVKSDGAALLGGLVFGLSPYMLSQSLAHANLAQAYIPPLVWILLDETFVRQRRSPVLLGAGLGVLAAAQLLTTEEILASLALAGMSAVMILVALRRNDVRSRLPFAARTVGVGLLVSALLMVLPLGYQFFGPQRVTDGPLQPAEGYSSDLLSFVVPTELQELNFPWADEITSRFTDACCLAEWGSYVGLPLLVLLVVIAVRHWSKLIVRFAAIFGLVFAVLSMGPHLHIRGRVTSIPLPFAAIEALPVVESMLPRRLTLYMFLAIAVLLAVFADELATASTRRLRLVGTASLAVALVPLIPAFPYPATDVRIPEFFQSEAVRRIPKGSVALVVPFARDTASAEPMLWQTVASMRYRMPEGYIVGPDSDGRFVYLPERSALSDAMEHLRNGGAAEDALDEQIGILRAMRERRVESVIVGPAPYRSEYVSFFSQLLGRRPLQTGGVQLWLDVDPEALLSRAPTPPSPG